MAKQYIYAAINPIWMNPVTTFNPDYNTVPFDFQQPKICYSQKYQTAEVVTLQVLSDWLPVLKIYNAITGFFVDHVIGDTPLNGIINQTFTFYQFTITWADYAPGSYYIEITYTDDDSIIQTERSGLIQTAANWPQTLLIEYTNSYNAFSAIFDPTQTVFKLRVEGNIADYSPAFEDVIYNDQEYNTTKLNSIPRREFNLYIGSNRGFAGIPQWMGDKVNWAFACDQIKIDGVYYQNVTGSKWDVKRTDPDGTNFIGLQIGIIEVINLFLQAYQAGQMPADSIQVITRVLPFLDNSMNITIAGTFKTNSVLSRIIIYNLGGDIFTMEIGTAADGSQPIAPPFTTEGTPQVKEVWEINEPFESAQTVYITGLAGTNCNIFVEYDQLDAPLIAPITNTKKFAIGTRYEYEEPFDGAFEIHWNVGTGAGNPDTDYEGCVLSGTNGTKDMNGLVAIGWDDTMPLTRDILVGNAGNVVTVARQNLPAEGLNVNGLTINNSYRTGGNSQHAAANDPSAPLATTENMGSGVPLNIANAARITVFFVCLTD